MLMRTERIAKICSGQDGAIWNRFLFRFKSNGECCVYDLEALSAFEDGEAAALSRFQLDKSELLMPHSNAVSFGCEYAAKGDEFPLLYTNIYNTYAKAENRMEGVCCVYRLWREGTGFETELVQLIRVGFTGDPTLWCSPDGRDVRPYGNFVIDREKGKCYVFTMRDAGSTTRYFAFRLPRLGDGDWDARLGIRQVTLLPSDVVEWFDCPYQHYVQGACASYGRIYSLEGFTNDPINPPALRIIDLQQRQEAALYRLEEAGLTIEPELIDFCDGRCLYADHDGNLYEILF